MFGHSNDGLNNRNVLPQLFLTLKTSSLSLVTDKQHCFYCRIIVGFSTLVLPWFWGLPYFSGCLRQFSSEVLGLIWGGRQAKTHTSILQGYSGIGGCFWPLFTWFLKVLVYPSCYAHQKKSSKSSMSEMPSRQDFLTRIPFKNRQMGPHEILKLLNSKGNS